MLILFWFGPPDIALILYNLSSITFTCWILLSLYSHNCVYIEEYIDICMCVYYIMDFTCWYCFCLDHLILYYMTETSKKVMLEVLVVSIMESTISSLCGSTEKLFLKGIFAIVKMKGVQGTKSYQKLYYWGLLSISWIS